ncbi:MAG: YhcH/YjgK/YiaL family protein [Planctomycetaceae bacterium]|nr:YhcH/YjgK/YiaL family protein [Planctomycetaceae bacterium]
MLSTATIAQNATPGVLTLLYETNNPGGKYGDLNVHAVWVEKADGTFVQTLDSWGKEHAKQLKQWTAADKKWKLHARTGATLMAYGPFITRWNATDASGSVIPDGDYIVRLELTNDNANKNKFSRVSIPLCKTAQPVTVGALDAGGYKQILLSWRPGGTEPPLPKSTLSPIPKDPNMILDELNKTLSHGQLNPRIMKGLELLKDKSVLSAELGKHEVDGTNLYYSVDEYQSKPWEQGRPEIHQKYLDIQYMVSGTECMGFCPLEGLTIDQPYNTQKDVAFYKYAPGMTKLVLRPGMLAIFWPNEPHMPSRQIEQPQTVRKIVIKVKMD